MSFCDAKNLSLEPFYMYTQLSNSTTRPVQAHFIIIFLLIFFNLIRHMITTVALASMLLEPLVRWFQLLVCTKMTKDYIFFLIQILMSTV